jgi:endonuclease G
MKSLQLLLVAILLAGCQKDGFSQLPPNENLRESVIVETEIFKVNYSEVLEQPLWVEYTVQCPLPGVDRDGLDFYEEVDVHTSDDDDYYRNEWDKGHMAPAAAFNCTREMLKKTFSYLNSALQHESLNRGVWNHLERFERNLANFYEVKVRIDIIFDENPQRVPTGAAIPKEFKKTIMFDDRSEVFIFPNQNTSGTDWTDYYQAK